MFEISSLICMKPCHDLEKYCLYFLIVLMDLKGLTVIVFYVNHVLHL